MIDFSVLKTRVSVSPLFFAVLTLVLLVDKTGVSGYAVLFSLLHELGHIFALLCTKTFPEAVVLTVFGIHIKLPGNLSTAKECLVLMAGFTVNFLLAFLFHFFEKTVFEIVNLAIGIFTALPLPSTDGGTVLKTFLENYLPQKAKKTFEIISVISVFIFSFVFILFSVLTKNYFIFIAVIYMIFCTIKTAA